LRSAPVEGFRLAYDREGSAPSVVLLDELIDGDRAAARTH
jgi:hypothetical protein